MYLRYVHMSGLLPGMCRGIGVRVVDFLMAHLRISGDRLCVNLHAFTYVRYVHMSGQMSGMCRAIGVSVMQTAGRLGDAFRGTWLSGELVLGCIPVLLRSGAYVI